LIKQLLVKNPE